MITPMDQAYSRLVSARKEHAKVQRKHKAGNVTTRVLADSYQDLADCYYTYHEFAFGYSIHTLRFYNQYLALSIKARQAYKYAQQEEGCNAQ